MKKTLWLLIGIVFSVNVGLVQNAAAQGRHHGEHGNHGENRNHGEQRNHKEQRNDKKFRHEERRQDHFVRHENRGGYNRGPIRRNRVVYGHPAPRFNMPFWASAHKYRGRHAVYFRDYNAFYDPNRGGYVYWLNGAWVFSSSVPLFMANFDLNRARVNYINDVPYDARPELYYRRYAKRYPRNNRIQINIPLPPF